MAFFKAGQKVVLVRGINCIGLAKNAGATAVFSRYEANSRGRPTRDGSPLRADADCIVVYDGPVGESYEQSMRLEPHQDANEKSAWSECVWKPEHLRTTVTAP